MCAVIRSWPRRSERLSCVCSQLELLASTTPSSEEVERAKRACEANVLAALEMPSVVSEDIARQILSYGERISVDEFRKEVQVSASKPEPVYISLHRIASAHLLLYPVQGSVAQCRLLAQNTQLMWSAHTVVTVAGN